MRSQFINVLEPGPLLNALVWDSVFEKKGLWESDLDFSMLGNLFTLVHGFQTGADYSESDADALFVVQAIIQKAPGKEIEFVANISNVQSDEHRVWVQFFDTRTGKIVDAYGRTLAHAVCLAALKFVNPSELQELTIGQKVYKVGRIEPPEVHMGTVTEVATFPSGVKEYLVKFTPENEPSYVSLVTSVAVNGGAVSPSKTAAILSAAKAERNNVRGYQQEADTARKREGLIKGLLDE